MAILRVRGLGVGSGLLLIAALAGCRTSPPPKSVPQATSPFGEPVSVTLTNRQSFTGELLAVTDSSLILMVRDRVAFARAGSIARARLRGFGLEYTNGARPSSRSLERARRSARFPYGVSPEVMAVLLGRTSQSAPDDLATLQP